MRWKPNNELNEDQLDQYLSLAKAVRLFARAIETNCPGSTGNPVSSDGVVTESSNGDASSRPIDTETGNSNQDDDEDDGDDDDDDEDTNKSENNVNDSQTVASNSEQLHSALKGLVIACNYPQFSI